MAQWVSTGGHELDPSILGSILCVSVILALVDKDTKAAQAKLCAGHPHSSSVNERLCLKVIKSLERDT